eukprot:1075049-Pyramimonas_sp.AAC.1
MTLSIALASLDSLGDSYCPLWCVKTDRNTGGPQDNSSWACHYADVEADVRAPMADSGWGARCPGKGGSSVE